MTAAITIINENRARKKGHHWPRSLDLTAITSEPIGKIVEFRPSGNQLFFYASAICLLATCVAIAIYLRTQKARRQRKARFNDATLETGITRLNPPVYPLFMREQGGMEKL